MKIYEAAPLSYIIPASFKKQLLEWLDEDLPSFDIAAAILAEPASLSTTDQHISAELYMKTSGIVAGFIFVHYLFELLSCHVDWLVHEGHEWLKTDAQDRLAIARISGSPDRVLQGERISLNILARCSGIATRARRYDQIKEQHGFKGRIAGTRKTTPGFRWVEKYGLLIGHVDPHRMDLSSTIMLKDNHITLLKHQDDLPSIIKRISQLAGFTQLIEVECTTEEQAEQCILGGATIIMLDNKMPKELKQIAENIKTKYPHVILEASGGISEETLASYFCPYVDVISCGALTQGVPHVDFSLKFIKWSTPS